MQFMSSVFEYRFILFLVHAGVAKANTFKVGMGAFAEFGIDGKYSGIFLLAPFLKDCMRDVDSYVAGAFVF